MSVIRSDQARVDVADFAVFGLDARENKSVEQDGEALAARNGSDRIRGLPRLAEDLRVLGMSRAVDVPQFVRPSGGHQQKRACEQDEKTCARHSPPPRPGDTPSLENHFEAENEGLKPFEGTGIPKKTPVRKAGWVAGWIEAPRLRRLGVFWITAYPALTRWAKLWHASGVRKKRRASSGLPLDKALSCEKTTLGPEKAHSQEWLC